MSFENRNSPIFRQIFRDNVVPIQETISVDFDNNLQTPVSFSYMEYCYEIIELIGTYRDHSSNSVITFLVRTPQGVFTIYLDVRGPQNANKKRYFPGQPGQWVLHYYVEENPSVSEVDMLVEMRLKQIADFHGHLCPDLVIGYRAAQYALSRLEIKLAMPDLRVIVENCTSAVDAIQILTGCTPGNQRLSIRDEGKHVYTFKIDEQHGLCLTLAPAGQYVPAEYLGIERKIQAGATSLEETAIYQHMLDQRIVRLLQSTPEELFNTRWVEVAWPELLLSSNIKKCDGCGEPVIESRLANVLGRQLCQRCLETRKTIQRKDKFLL